MRLFEIFVYMYDQKTEELTGVEQGHASDERRRCVIDLDEVSAAWEGKDEGIVILLKNRDSIWTKDITIDEFKNKWQGDPVIESVRKHFAIN